MNRYNYASDYKRPAMPTTQYAWSWGSIDNENMMKSQLDHCDVCVADFYDHKKRAIVEMPNIKGWLLADCGTFYHTNISARAVIKILTSDDRFVYVNRVRPHYE